jgi:colicin import membrane protein
MTSVEFRVSSVIPASPNRIFGAWMDERQHSAIAGTKIRIDPWIGGRVHGWDGAIFASHLRLETGRRIALAFRTRDFPSDAPDSYVDITLEPAMGGTQVSVVQKAVPPELKKTLEAHWRRSYLEPMKRFFGNPEGMRNALKKASRSGLLEVSSLNAERRGPEREPDQVFKSSPGTLPAAEGAIEGVSKKPKTSNGLRKKSRALVKPDVASGPARRAPVAAVKTAAVQKAAKKASESMNSASEPATNAAEATKQAAEKTVEATKKAAEKTAKAAKKAAKEAAKAVKKAAKKTAKSAKKSAKKAAASAKKTAKKAAKAVKKTTKKAAASAKKTAKKATKKAAASAKKTAKTAKKSAKKAAASAKKTAKKAAKPAKKAAKKATKPAKKAAKPAKKAAKPAKKAAKPAKKAAKPAKKAAKPAKKAANKATKPAKKAAKKR